MNCIFSRRQFLQNALVTAGSGTLASCGGSTVLPEASASVSHASAPIISVSHRSASENTLYIFASSGVCEDSASVQIGLDRLSSAGFVISNHVAAYRRFQRFAGSDAERIADLQNIASGSVETPKVLMGTRGGYGAARLLQHIDWGNLGARMREMGTLLFGFSDVTAIQLALMAQSGVPSFSGPMLYSDFGKTTLSIYTMDSFIRTTTSTSLTVAVPGYQMQRVQPIEGILWGGNLSVIASLVGSPYMPRISGGILFLEDVSEQPYRIERMLYTLHLAGVLRSQQAIVLGDFRIGNIRDSYDSSYDLNTVVQNVARVTGIPVYSGFPFGHIANKTTFPLGTHARLLPDNSGGYQIVFSDYPTLKAQALNLSALLPPSEQY